MAALIRNQKIGLMQRCILSQLYKNSRAISTSKKNSDTVAAACEPRASTEKKEENWVSYGFDYKNKEEDTNVHHATFFFSVTLCMVFGGFMWGYAPDVHQRDWASREAFLELRRREQCGLPLIDRNYVDPSTVNIPSDEELGDTEIII